MPNILSAHNRYRPALLVGVILLLISVLAFGYVQKAVADHGDHVVISEIQIDSTPGSGGAGDDFVELYNPTDSTVDLSTWSVQKTTATGTSNVKINLTGSIAAHGYYLIVRGGAVQTLLDLADDVATSSFSIAANNVVYLVANQDTIADASDAGIVDMVGLGDAAIFEGNAAIANPAEGGSVERMSGNPHEDNMGNGQDTNDNLADFMQSGISNPQNTSSAIESEITQDPGENPEDPPEEDAEDNPPEDPQNGPEDNPEEKHGDDQQETANEPNFFEEILSRIVSRFLNRDFPSFPSFGDGIRGRLPGNGNPPQIPVPTI